MKKILCVVVGCCLAIAGFTQSKDSHTSLLEMIPAGTDMVLAFKPAQLFQKIPKEAFEKSTMYQMITSAKDVDSKVKQLFENPAILGIDLSSDLLFTMQTDTISLGGMGIMSLYGHLDNSEAFGKMIQELSDENAFKSLDQDIKIFMPNEMGGAIAWNKEMFVLTNANTARIRSEMIQHFSLNDTITVTEEIVVEEKKETYQENFDYEKLKEKSVAYTVEYMTSIFSGKQAGNFQNNRHLIDVLSKTDDIRTWSSGMGFLQSLRKFSPRFADILGGLMNIAGTDKTSIINFEKGKITGESYNYLNDKIAAIHEKHKTEPQNLNLLKRIPAHAKVLAVMNGSFNSDMAKEMLRESGLTEMLESLKSELPFKPELLHSTFGNQFMVALVHNPQETEVPAEHKGIMKPTPFRGMQLMAVLPIANKLNFRELYSSLNNAVHDLKNKLNSNETSASVDNNAATEEFEIGQQNPFKEILNSMKLSVQFDENYVVISGSKKLNDSYLANIAGNDLPGWIPQSTNSPMLTAIDFHGFMKTVLDGIKVDENGGKGTAEMMIGLFDKIIVTGGNYSNGAISSKMEFSFADKEKNTFLSLFNMMNAIMGEKQKFEEEFREKRRYEFEKNNSEEAKDELLSLEIPKFADKEVQKFVKEYIDYVVTYLNVLEKGDIKKMEKLSEKMEGWSKRSLTIGEKLAKDPEEARKFSDFMTQVSTLMAKSISSTVVEEKKEDVSPPPPPAKNKNN